MTRWDVRAFDLFAPLYDLFMPSADDVALRKGLYCADRELERIVEVGGGSGRAAREVGATVVDPAAGMCRRARGRGLEAIQGTGEELPIANRSVDAVLIVDALHHFADRQRALSEAARALRPGGVVVIREFDRGTRRGRALAIAERLVGFDSAFYTAEELSSALEAAGLAARPVEYGFGMTVVGVRED